MQLDPDRARELAEQGAAILLLDVPAGTRIGLDHQSFVVAAGFRGFKMVPPGPHYLAYNAASRQGQFAPTVAVLAHLAGRQVLVRRWSPQHELLLPLADEDEAERYAEGVRRFDFDSGLVPYPLDTYSAWRRLTPHVSEAAVARLAPAQPNMSVTAETDPAAQRAPTAAEARMDAQLAERQPSGGEGGAPPAAARVWTDALVGRCLYMPLPRLQKTAGLSAAELTAQNLDKSSLLESVIRQHCSGDANELLAEFELGFVAFLYGQSLEGFAQWKEIMQLALGCERAALQTHTRVFVDLLCVLQAQFQCGMGDRASQPGGGSQKGSADTDVGVLIEELLPASFLQRSIGGLLQMLDDNAMAAPRELVEEAGKLQRLLQQHLSVRFDMHELGHDESDDEYAPVVVEM